jgi:hypothetical protein
MAWGILGALFAQLTIPGTLSGGLLCPPSPTCLYHSSLFPVDHFYNNSVKIIKKPQKVTNVYFYFKKNIFSR